MPLERSEITVRQGQGAAFVAVMRDRASAVLLSCAGCSSVSVGLGIENPDKILILVDWETMAAHDAFRTVPAYAEFQKMIGPFALNGAMEHFDMA